MSNIYCTYLTTYFGNKLPPFYIGSSSVRKIQNGYKGSVSSTEYQPIWQQELKEHPKLFRTKILTTHPNRNEATSKELFFQEKLNVVDSPMYINKSLARKNGFFGRDVSGSQNPRYGFKWGNKHPRGMTGKHHSRKTLLLFSQQRKGKQLGDNNPARRTDVRKKIGIASGLSRLGKKRGPYKTKNSSPRMI